jgi:hypothetical protein
VALISSAFLETIIVFLLPYFHIGVLDVQDARNEIVDTLKSYATRTRAEMLQAAQIIALGMTTLDVLAEAKTVEMSQSMRIRYRGCANGLNRSTLHTEKALDRRLAQELPPAVDAMPEQVDDLPDADVNSAIAFARTAIESHRNGLTEVRPVTETQAEALTERDKQIWAGAMMNTMQRLGIPVQPPEGT